MKPCLVCGQETGVLVNINWRPVPVCDHCCVAITKQTVSTLTVERWHMVDGTKGTTITSERQ